MTIYNYKKELDVQNDKYPINTHLCVESVDGTGIYFVDSADQTIILKLNTSDGTISTIIDESYNIFAMYHDVANEKIYYSYAYDGGATYRFTTKYIDESDDSVNAYADQPCLSSYDTRPVDIVAKSDASLYLFAYEGQGGGPWNAVIEMADIGGSSTAVAAPETGLGSNPVDTIQMSYMTVISDYAYMLYQTTTNHVYLYKTQLTAIGSSATLLYDFGANTNLSTSYQLRGISYDGSDVLYFVIKDTTDSKNYLYTYSIAGDSATKKGEYNVALMLDRNTFGSQVGFNLEKGFHLTSRYVYQIASSKGNLYQIADLTNVLYTDNSAVDGTIVAITDTYLFLKRSSNDIELWKYQDFSSHYFVFDIMMHERDYPTAYMEYDSRRIGIGQGVFVQCIGNVRVKGSTAVDVKFEGYCLKPEQMDEEAVYLKNVDLLSPAFFDLQKSIDGSYTGGDTDGDIDELDDRFDYVTKGTYDDGQAIDNMTIESEKKTYRFLDELAIGDQGTWGIRPKGLLDYVLSADDSGIDYDQSTPIYGVIVSTRVVQYNQVTVKGAYVDGALVQSDPANNQADQDQRGIQGFEVTIAWIQTKAVADAWATAILAMLSTEYTEIQFSVRDATNGFVPPTEQFTIADSNKGVTSAQFWINSLIHHDKTSITEYVVSSAVRWDDEDLAGKLTEDLSDQVGQVAGSVSGNISDIATNTSDITTLQSQIATLTYYVPRGATLTAFDFTIGDLTLDSTWRTLDLSSIVPSECVAVVVLLELDDSTTGQQFFLGDPTYYSAYQDMRTRYARADSRQDNYHGIVPVRSQSIKYYGEAGFDSINISISGWFRTL